MTTRGTAFSAGQLAEVNTAVTVGVASALPRVAAKFGDPRAVLKALKNKGEIFTGHLESALAQAIGRMMTLVPRESVSITLAERHDPAIFYKEEQMLIGVRHTPGIGHLDGHFGGFSQVVLPKAKPVEVGTKIAFDIFEIGNPGGAPHDQIEGALPKHHLFGESVLCALIAEMISKQPRGEPGMLEHTGKANLFYFSPDVTIVRWSNGMGSSSLTRGWQIYARERQYTYRFDAGDRVFSPAN